MNQDQIAVIHECVTGSLAGRLKFPQVVGKLHAIGVERYHADYTRHEATYYFPDGQSHVEAVDHPPMEIAPKFSQPGVAAAIGRVQRSEIDYIEFLRLTMSAGCVGYFVQITGRQAIYFGRDGEIHVEPFPAAK
jgi:uncharacterized protein YbcV (DUF1398 family)